MTTIRRICDAVYALFVEEARQAGLSVLDAIKAVDDMLDGLRPRTDAEREAERRQAEAEAGRRTQQAMQNTMAQLGMAAPPTRRTATA